MSARVVKKIKPNSNKPRSPQDRARSTFQNLIQLAQLRSEKCELREAQAAYGLALQAAKRMADSRAQMEALAGLFRMASETLDEAAMQKWESELDALIDDHPKQVAAMAWYCKGAVARHRMQHRLAQRYFHRYVQAVQADPKHVTLSQLMSPAELEARGWIGLASVLFQRGKLRRAETLVRIILKHHEKENLRGVNGIAYLILGSIVEKRGNYAEALTWFQKSHGSFLVEHNWFHHLYALFAYARIARRQQNFAQAYWYLELLDKASASADLGMLMREVAAERSKLQQDAVDLLIDGRVGVVRTREAGEISIGKQYVLLHILEALFKAHRRAGSDMERGMSKAEIIENVWHEAYRPEAHDNKLYYNINRLRKLIEPDVKKPRYLLNWKEGYRLAPGLRVQFIGTIDENALELHEGERQ